MIPLQPIDIENAVIKLCDEFGSSSSSGNELTSSEGNLWKGMTTCVLSSQVGYETATIFSQRLSNENLLPPSFDHDYGEQHERHLFDALCTPMNIQNSKRRYRFPKEKARQIAKTAEHFYRNQLRLTEFFANDNDPKTIRCNLVEHVTGLGPKQASMFIRDANKSEDLAIIDRHILDYMVLVDLISSEERDKFSASKYLSYEAELENYANFIGHPVGRLDWAIWIVMRTLKKEKLH